jgi:hypothetical protein
VILTILRMYVISMSVKPATVIRPYTNPYTGCEEIRRILSYNELVTTDYRVMSISIRPSREIEPCIQYSFAREEEGCEFLIENGARSMQVFLYPSSALQAWIAANPCVGKMEEQVVPQT